MPSYSQFQENITHTDYETKIISSGNNFPSIDISESRLHYLLVMIRSGIDIQDIKKELNWNTKEINQHINTLLKEGLLKEINDTYFPACMVITAHEGKQLYNLCEPLITPTLQIIEKHSKQIITLCKKIDTFKQLSIEACSLLLYSGVLLDFGQINNIEKNYLKSERPLRNNKRYYYSIQEKEKTNEEAFGIYGNHYLDLGELQICLYGNRRYTTTNLITANEETLEEYFQQTILDVNQLKKQLVQKFVSSDTQIDVPLRSFYERVGLYKNSKPIIPVFQAADLIVLDEIADTISEDLITLLQENEHFLKGYYLSSSYAKEITYEEFFIWWYHFFYTKVTEELIKCSKIKNIAQENQTYIVLC
ncbi:hypothetical protein [Bacillus multifaciens]|uniref:hypothetical protein n=1 Tax=Bacillus multifaciens TaxID=3068506 RepID=UPI0027412684|nr:hypothetical protein [Bacillus sp. WLY-B-L8]MDP7978631.1 hypothetical protein [Bacillus sp. WLY-B-L8]